MAAMNFSGTWSVEVERIQGKFAGRDEIAELIDEALCDALSNLQLDSIGADGDSEYEVTDSAVNFDEPKKEGK